MDRNSLLPFAATLAAIALLSLMDALMKGAALAVGAFSALLLRSWLNLSVVGPVWLLKRTGPTSPVARRVHVRRGIVISFMGLTFFWGLARLPLAEGLALSFIAPLLALYLAAILLGERIRRRAVAAALLGLAGVFLIAFTRMYAQETESAGHPEAAWGIASIVVSSALYAWNLVLQRQQAQLARPLEVATWQNFMVGCVLLLGAPWLLEWPAGPAWVFIVCSGVLSLAGAMLMAWAYARSEAQVLVPLEYTGFAWAALFGWLFFAETVRTEVLAGAALIVLGCWLAAPRKSPEQVVI